jgi:hypothetical protein
VLEEQQADGNFAAGDKSHHEPAHTTTTTCTWLRAAHTTTTTCTWLRAVLAVITCTSVTRFVWVKGIQRLCCNNKSLPALHRCSRAVKQTRKPRLPLTDLSLGADRPGYLCL